MTVKYFIGIAIVLSVGVVLTSSGPPERNADSLAVIFPGQEAQLEEFNE